MIKFYNTRENIIKIALVVFSAYLAAELLGHDNPPLKKDVKFDAEFKIRSDSSLVLETSKGLIIGIESKDIEVIGISQGLNNIATLIIDANGVNKIFRYLKENEFDVSIQDINGDGMPDRVIKWRNGNIKHAYKVEYNLIEITE